MPPDSLLRRVRWGNLARLLALPTVVLLVVLWPRLSPAPPRLPTAAPQPVAAPASGGPGDSRARVEQARAPQRSGAGEPARRTRSRGAAKRRASGVRARRRRTTSRRPARRRTE